MLEHGRALRAAIYGLLSRIGDGAAPRRTDVAALNRWIASTAPHRALVPGARAFSWRWRDGGQAGLERALWPVVQSTVDLLTSDALARVKRCDADDCGWLFVDASKNRSRRWCAMRECGNLAKVRRFRARRRKR
jgi:predicted RNA-binding Zn ribbon-like protein